MGVYLGNTGIGKMYLGSTEIAKAYLGSTKVYSSSLLPTGYTELPYVSSVNGGGWVDTDILPSDTLGYRIKFLCQSVNPIDAVLWGVIENSSVRYWMNIYNAQIIIGWGDNQPPSGQRFSISANTWYTLSVNYMNSRTHYFRESNQKELSGTLPNFTYTFQLFGRNSSSSGRGPARESSIARLTFTLGTDIIADMIPCTSPNNEVGFYDIVRERFFGSGNGTPLIAGS